MRNKEKETLLNEEFLNKYKLKQNEITLIGEVIEKIGDVLNEFMHKRENEEDIKDIFVSAYWAVATVTFYLADNPQAALRDLIAVTMDAHALCEYKRLIEQEEQQK